MALLAGCTPTSAVMEFTQLETTVPPLTEIHSTEPDSDTTPLDWYALGDSITQGFYSYLDADGMATLGLDPQRCWAALAAESTGWELTNYGVGGSGYVHEGTVLDKLNARDHVDTIDFSGADLVTLAYGVNDWKYDMPLGTMEDNVLCGDTFYSNMRYCIEKIRSDNPEVQIIVISPINCSRYGSADTGWGIGYSFEQSGTLEDIFQAELEICEYYGIPLIDMLHGSTTVTTANAPDVLPDGVHPSLDCHAELALELMQKAVAVLEE